eukprot:TRINITY_DN2694_c0_g1_i5.p1 TRINITY_DN2694_c0_g1~~TRINITY_DN2694_c0_g1_i5.p1  ORF type:complete len:952 (+),score=138.49 TRINITY_DN2694_c0_g1_i5:63-2918(+)
MSLSLRLRLFLALALVGSAFRAQVAKETPAFGAYRWTYSSPKSEPGRFFVGFDIQLRFVSDASGDRLDNQPVKWLVDADCVFSGNDTTLVGRHVVVNCKQAKEYRFEVTVDGRKEVDAFYITVEDPPSCFEWYLVTLNSNKEKQPLYVNEPSTLRIWIIDRKLASNDEIFGNSTVPSDVSRIISKQMHILSEGPVFTVLSASHISDITPFPQRFLFNETLGVWEATYLSTFTNNIKVSISGYDVGILGCKTRPSIKKIYILPENAKSLLLSSGSFDSNSLTAEKTIQMNSCSTNIAAVVLKTSSCSNTIVLTMNEFASIIFSKTLNSGDCFQSVIPRRSGLFTILLYSANLNRNQVYVSSDFINYKSSDLTEPVDNIQANEACDSMYASPDYKDSVRNHIIFAWPDGKNYFFVSLNDGLTFQKIVSPEQYEIYDISVQISVPYYALVVGFEDQVKLVRYNYMTESEQDFSTAFTFPSSLRKNKIIKPKVRAVVSGSAEVFVFAHGLFYSGDGGSSAIELSLVRRNPDKSRITQADQEEYIVDIQTTKIGEYLVVTSQNRLYYGSLASRSLMEIQSGVPALAVAYFYMRLDEALIGFLPDGKSPFYVEPYMVPYNNEVISQIEPIAYNTRTYCPYKNWVDQLNAVSYSLDIRDSLSTPLSILNSENVALGFSFVTSRPDILVLSETSSYTPGGSIVTTESRLDLHPQVEKNVSTNYPTLLSSTGRTEVRIMPKACDLTCPIQQKVMEVQVGCPVNRRIKVSSVKYDAKHCPGWDGTRMESSIPSSADRRTPLALAENDPFYHVNRYGCPIRRYQGTTGFRFALELYDGDHKVEDVNANFVIYEINGRSDYAYTKSEIQAGCRVAQHGWSDRLLQGKPDDAWTSKNHMNCFVSNSSLGAASKKSYEVMNSTFSNGLDFLEKDGLYVFQVRVVDLEYRSVSSQPFILLLCHSFH